MSDERRHDKDGEEEEDDEEEAEEEDHEPPEARKPAGGWRLYVFKGKEQVGECLSCTRYLPFLRVAASLEGRGWGRQCTGKHGEKGPFQVK